MLTDAQLEALDKEVSDQVAAIIRERVDREWPGVPDAKADRDRYRATATLGRAMIVLGIAFLGPALGIRDPDISLGEVNKLLIRIGEIAKLHRNQN